MLNLNYNKCHLSAK